MIKLKLPPTLCAVEADSLSQEFIENSPNAYQRAKELPYNRIEQGYIELESKPTDIYNIFLEINIDNNRLWSFFKTVMMSMPEEVSLILVDKDVSSNDRKNISWSEYISKYTIYNTLEEYEPELTQDGFLQFGVIHQTKDYLEEIFVASSKYIQYWGMDSKKIIDILHSFSIYHNLGMEFLDSYPMQTTSLTHIDPSFRQTAVVLEELREKTNSEFDI